MNKITKIILRFGLLIIGIILTIFYYLNIGISQEISSFGIIFIIVGLLLALRRSKEKLGYKSSMSSVNGIGTTLYGKREIESDGSYISTKWFILLLLPIFPISSYRVLPSTTKIHFLGQKTDYLRFEKVPLNKKQIINIYLLIYGFIFFVFILPAIILN